MLGLLDITKGEKIEEGEKGVSGWSPRQLNGRGNQQRRPRIKRTGEKGGEPGVVEVKRKF